MHPRVAHAARGAAALWGGGAAAGARRRTRRGCATTAAARVVLCGGGEGLQAPPSAPAAGEYRSQLTGPPPSAAEAAAASPLLAPGETLDHLAGGWRVFQLRKGNRWSTDDMAVAWRAATNVPHATRLLDLGCGVGSVGLLTLWRMAPHATLTAVEVQEMSYNLYRKTIAHNDLAQRVSLHHSDMRGVRLDVPGEGGARGFELVTGSPPYFPVGTAVAAAHPQKQGARMELKGSVYDYCTTARKYLAPGGRFCFVLPARDPRTEAAPVAAGLVILERCDFVFKGGRPPLISTLLCARAEDGPHPPRRALTLTVRDADGEWTEEYRAMKREMGSW